MRSPSEILWHARVNSPDDLHPDLYAEYKLAELHEQAQRERLAALRREQRLAGLKLGREMLQQERVRLTEKVRQALITTHGNKSRAAKLLGIGRTTLYRHYRIIQAEQQNPTTEGNAVGGAT